MLQIGCGIEGYMELKLDWKGRRDAIAAAVTDEDGGVGPGVRGDSVPLASTFKLVLSTPSLTLLLLVMAATSEASVPDVVEESAVFPPELGPLGVGPPPALAGP